MAKDALRSQLFRTDLAHSRLHVVTNKRALNLRRPRTRHYNKHLHQDQELHKHAEDSDHLSKVDCKTPGSSSSDTFFKIQVLTTPNSVSITVYNRKSESWNSFTSSQKPVLAFEEGPIYLSQHLEEWKPETFIGSRVRPSAPVIPCRAVHQPHSRP